MPNRSQAAAVLAAALSASPALAAEGGQSPYLKGYRDISAGIIPPYPGWYVRNDLVYYGGKIDAVVLNGRVEANLKVNSLADMSAFSLVTERKILGGQYSLAIAFPVIAYADIKASATGPLGNTVSRSDDKTAVTDLFIVPVSLGWHNGKVHTNASLGIYLPTGPYDVNRLANVSKNYAAVFPGVAVTWMDPASGWDVSGALTYVFAFENHATDYDTGDLLHFDGAVTKKVGDFRLGFVGYAMVQTTGDSGAGAALGSFKSKVYGVGPILSYEAKIGERPVNLYLKWAHEFDAKKTLEGDTVTAAFAFKF